VSSWRWSFPARILHRARGTFKPFCAARACFIAGAFHNAARTLAAGTPTAEQSGEVEREGFRC